MSKTVGPSGTVIDVDILGTTFRVHGAPREVRNAMRDLAASRPPSSELTLDRSADSLRLTDETGRTIAVVDPSRTLDDQLSSVFNRLGLDADADRLHLHAAMVEIDGAGIVLPAPSGAGKSTLTAQLLRRGHRYLTDETVALTPGASAVAAYPKPLMLKDWALAEFAPWLGASAGARAVPATMLGRLAPAAEPRHLVFPTFERGAATSVTRVGPAAAVIRLFGETLDAGRFGPESVDVLAALACSTAAWDLRYGSVDEACEYVEHIGRTEPTPIGWTAAWRSRHAISVVIDGSSITFDAATGAISVDGDTTLPPPSSLRTAPSANRRAWSIPEGFAVDGYVTLVTDGPDLGRASGCPTTLLVALAGGSDATTLAAAHNHAVVGIEAVLAGHPAASALPLAFLLDHSLPLPGVAPPAPALHPRHRLLRACLMYDLEPTAEHAAAVNTRGWLPHATLRRFVSEAGSFGLDSIARRSVIRSASEVAGVSRTMVEVIRGPVP